MHYLSVSPLLFAQRVLFRRIKQAEQVAQLYFKIHGEIEEDSENQNDENTTQQTTPVTEPKFKALKQLASLKGLAGVLRTVSE